MHQDEKVMTQSPHGPMERFELGHPVHTLTDDRTRHNQRHWDEVKELAGVRAFLHVLEAKNRIFEKGQSAWWMTPVPRVWLVDCVGFCSAAQSTFGKKSRAYGRMANGSGLGRRD